MKRLLATACVPATLAACSAGDAPPPEIDSDVARVAEVFITKTERFANLDSPAVWTGAAGQTWLVTTGKLTHRLYVYDASSGALVKTVGGRGSRPGQFRRPNGIAIVGDFALVVERDNRRVQVLRLPEFEPVMTFGEGVLANPYGVAVDDRRPADMIVYVTDNYQIGGGPPPRRRDLSERVKRYLVTVRGRELTAAYLGAFGDTAGPGRLLGVESLAVDSDAGIVLIADEVARDVKLYRTDGRFTGRVLWGEVIRHEPEGIVLYACGPKEGYWIVADQHRRENRFLVFSRQDFALAGTFMGATVRNTDGIALLQRPSARMPSGALFAVHNDRAVAAISWRDVAKALGMRDDCVAPPADG